MEKKVDFENAQELRKQYPDSFYAPGQQDLERILPGDFVKVCAYRERFWVEVKDVADGLITGRIDNHLITRALRFDEIISFKPEHVYNIIKQAARNTQAGDSKLQNKSGEQKKKHKGKGL